jgi:hypothetical protein
VGIWYSGNQPDEPGVLSLIEFREDGTFREEFRKCEDGNVVGVPDSLVFVSRRVSSFEFPDCPSGV